jgi:transposase-like protein
MPWKIASVLEERTRFISEYWEQDTSVAELCRRYEISRKTADKWVTRHGQAGLEGLQDQARVTKAQPHAITAEVEDWILRGRSLHPTWGPKSWSRGRVERAG